MGKRQHSKDRLYVTCTEWALLYGGKKSEIKPGGFKRLPFDCCSISLLPFESPMCTTEGVCFDEKNVIPFVRKFELNPVTGEAMKESDLIRLSFHKNSDGKYHCPISYKVFTENSHIVAIRPTGNVFEGGVVEQLCLRTGSLRDLMDESVSFTKKDVIEIQNPQVLDKFNICKFFHVMKSFEFDCTKAQAAADEADTNKPGTSGLSLPATCNASQISSDMRQTLAELGKKVEAGDVHLLPKSSYASNANADDTSKRRRLDAVNAANYSTGMVGASLTSTVMQPTTRIVADVIDEDTLKYARVKKKSYVQMLTSAGPLNFELHSDLVPRTCENFVLHCEAGYYNGTEFHRLIKHFMIQGGDPTGTGRGGESAFSGGAAFADEFRANLTHSERGILSMANSGPDTNRSQFYITFRSAPHLNRKHTIFGKLVGGSATLDALERIETDAQDRPLEPVRIIKTNVFSNPFREAIEQLNKEHEEAARREREAAAKAKAKASTNRPAAGPGPARPSTAGTNAAAPQSGVGKYLNLAALGKRK